MSIPHPFFDKLCCPSYFLNYLFLLSFMQKYGKQADYPKNRFKARSFCAFFPRSVWILRLLRRLFNICCITYIALFKILSARLRLCFIHSFVCCCLTCYCKGRESRGLCCEIQVLVIFT